MNCDNLSFEEAYSRLNTISNQLDSDKLSLEESVKLYEDASCLLRYCEKLLDEAEQKVRILRKNSDGSFSEENFDGE